MFHKGQSEETVHEEYPGRVRPHLRQQQDRHVLGAGRTGNYGALKAQTDVGGVISSEAFGALGS